MRRREFVTLLGGAAVAWPVTAGAQQSPIRPLVGVLSPLSAQAASPLITAFRSALRDLGYVEGRSATLALRYGAGVRTRALTASRPIKPTSLRCHSAWQPDPGRGSTYRCGKSVQTTGTTSTGYRQISVAAGHHLEPLMLMEAGLSDLGRRTLMTIHTRQPNSSKPDKNRSTSRTLTAVALLCMTVALPSGSAIGQSAIVALPSGRAIGQSGVSQNRLVGTWTYESIVVERTDGTRVAPFGSDPKGFITLSADGRYSLQLIRADIPKIASKDRLSGTAEENRAVAQGVLSQFGTYSVNEAEGTLTLHVETSSFPNENGMDQERIIASISADKLQWTNPTPTTPGIAYSTLRRARAPAEPPQ
jgi:hypothetical protein